MAFADTHGSVQRGLSIAKRALAARVHAVVCAGDFTAMGALWKEGIAPLIFSERKLLAIPGNHEKRGQMEEVVAAFPWVIDIDGAAFELGPFSLVGFGAVGLDHDDWEPEAALEELDIEDRRVVLVTHVPPGKAGRTERALLDFVERTQPELVISGHMHRHEGRRYSIGSTSVACVGKQGAVLDIPV